MITILAAGWQTPPLRSNDRLHWAKKARRTKEFRHAAAWQAACRVLTPTERRTLAGPVIITMVWEVNDHRVRDAGSMAPTLKVWIDALVDAGWLPKGDGWQHVREERCRVEHTGRKALRVEIQAVSDTRDKEAQDVNNS